MPARTRNGVDVPVNSDPYNIPADLKKAFESANLTIPVTNATERNALAGKYPNGVLPVGTSVVRLDLPGLIETWTGSRWFSSAGAVHLEVARTAGVNIASSLWGPGTPTELTDGVSQSASRNPSQFSFPVNNVVEVGIEGIYSMAWSATGFSDTASGFMTIRRDSTSQVLATGNFSAALDVSANRSSIYMAAGGKIRFNFQTDKAISCRHLLSITKIG